MSFVASIVGSVCIGGILLTLLGPLVFAIDRRALRQGNITAFRRGVLMVSSRGRRAAEVVRSSGTLRTAQGEGQWLTDDVVGFWSVANYRRSSYYFGWVGTATMVGHEMLFEVRLLRGPAIQQLGSLLACRRSLPWRRSLGRPSSSCCPSRRLFSGGRGGHCNKREPSRCRS